MIYNECCCSSNVSSQHQLRISTSSQSSFILPQPRNPSSSLNPHYSIPVFDPHHLISFTRTYLNMASIATGVAGLAIFALEVGTFIASLSGGVASKHQTSVTLILGDAPNSEGSVPDIHVLGPDAVHLTGNSDTSTYKDGHLEGSAAHAFAMNNFLEPRGPNNDGKPRDTQIAQPQYVAVHATGSDAICVSAVIANGNGATYTWTGDLGQWCGAQWVRNPMY